MKIIPKNTYRVQFNKEFNFSNLLGELDYLEKLGVHCIYASPIFQTCQGSTHGYNIVDFNKISEELGGYEEFIKLVNEVHRRNMIWMQDFVPNHMAFASENKMLMHVLEFGEISPYYNFFDIEWDHPYKNMKGKLLVPFLGKNYGATLESGELKITYDSEGLGLTYYDLRLPIRPESYIDIFEDKNSEYENDPDYLSFLGNILYLKNIMLHKDELNNFFDQIDHAKKMMWQQYQSNHNISQYVDQCLKKVNGNIDEPESFNTLDNLIFKQRFRPSLWKVASEEINYRRFFTINDLIGVKVEIPEVMDETHYLLKNLISKGHIDALRIDHIDGLFDPYRYINDLRKWAGDNYIVVEKILELEEKLPKDWRLEGTTGYDFLNWVNGLFCYPSNELKMDNIYRKFIQRPLDYEKLVLSKKLLIINEHLQGNIDYLSLYLKKISERDRSGRDITYYSLRKAMIEVISELSIYRTYISYDKIDESDIITIKKAAEKAIQRKPRLEYEMTFLKNTITLKQEFPLNENYINDLIFFVMSFQQITGPIMAKGLEDTVFFIYNRLISLNEVGGNPIQFGIDLKVFFTNLNDRFNHFPNSMNTTSTHDTKMGEDARVRLNIISELVNEWKQEVVIWEKMNTECFRKKKKGGPSKEDEYRLYQILLATFCSNENQDSYKLRIKDYMIKSVREAKVHSEWIRPNSIYEQSLIVFIDFLFDKTISYNFWNRFEMFVKKVSFLGYHNSLSQLIIKMTVTGVPDIYQGTEFWDFSLVDPDNRRSIDYLERASQLDYILSQPVGGDNSQYDLINELYNDLESGKIKIFIMNHLLRFRNEKPEFWVKSNCHSLEVYGDKKVKVISYLRSQNEDTFIIIVPRFLASDHNQETLFVGDYWGDTYVKLEKYDKDRVINYLTNETIEISDKSKIMLKDVFIKIPFAILL